MVFNFKIIEGLEEDSAVVGADAAEKEALAAVVAVAEMERMVSGVIVVTIVTVAVGTVEIMVKCIYS